MKYDVTVENVKKGVRDPGRVVDEIVYEYALRAPLTVVNGSHTLGTNVFDREWDVLVVLDTCRVDALRAVSEEYDFLNDVGSLWSTGGATAEWIARTFDERHAAEIGETAYLSANAHVQSVLDDQVHERPDSDKHLTYRLLRLMPTLAITDLAYYEYLFEYERWGEEGPRGHTAGMTPPRYVTDRAVDVARTADHDRLVLHYFQPHSPWVANALAEDRELRRDEDGWWGYLTETGDVETVWASYLDDLRYVLDDVALLVENIDAERVAITADHGEAFGEYGVLGHKIGSLHPKVRRVPWATTSGRDERTYASEIDPPSSSSMSAREVEDQLAALGYRT